MPCTVWRLSKVGLGNINYTWNPVETQTTALQKMHLISSWRHQSPSSFLFSVGVRRVGQDPSSRTKDGNRDKGHHEYTLLKVWGEGYMLEYTIFAKKEASMKTYRLTHVFKYAQLLNLFFFSWTGSRNGQYVRAVLYSGQQPTKPRTWIFLHKYGIILMYDVDG